MPARDLSFVTELMNYPEAVREFARYVALPVEQIRLDVAALLLARTEYPALDLAAQLKRLDTLAARAECDPGLSPQVNIASLNQLLYDEEKFAGNDEDYDDPRNSYLNDVLDRKVGIPITLSLVYQEVARRCGLPVVGVGFPGHFLAKYITASGEILLDPYHRGVTVSVQECEEKLKAQFGEEAEFRPTYLQESSTKHILTRMLNNLKGAFFRRKDFARVLMMIEMALAVDPASRQEIHDRAMIYFLIRRYGDAMADLRYYLSISPPDDHQIRSVRTMMHRIQAMHN
ncbi:MAG: transglutaminase-like domain-containing protein [Acidobacteriota bacterium]|nr:transglutaminase-like domain-containing protein [Acidobacteriota bacterium]